MDHVKKGKIEDKRTIPITPFPQDSISALYYVRTLMFPNNASAKFPLIADGRNLEAQVSVVRRETRKTIFGKIPTIVLKPEMKYQGILKKRGDIFVWLSDDARKIPVRLEGKVKIGTVVADLVEAEMGKQ